MAFFGVTAETLERVWAHPNADRLDLAKVEGMSFQFVVLKDTHKPGDRVLYFPIDSLLPVPVIEKLGLVGRLSGKDCNRVKTVKLRGQVSQGLVCRPETVLGDDPTKWPYLNAEHLTDYLEVTKYEPAPNFTGHCVLYALPDSIGVYNIEGADRFPDITEQMMDIPVSVTEKLEGYNFAAVRTVEGETYFCQHKNRIEEIEGEANVYCDTARRMGIPRILKGLSQLFPGQQIVLRGELIGPGIMGNIYKLSQTEIRFFDVQYGLDYASVAYFRTILPENLRVPEVASNVTLRDWLEGKTIQEASNGRSLLCPKIRREGVVVKPMEEGQGSFDGGLHRLFLKQRSPEYLAKEKD